MGPREKLRYFASNVETVDAVVIEDSKTVQVNPWLDVIPDGGIELPNIEYPYNQAILTQDAIKKLQGLLTTLKENPTLVIELGSHADCRGSDKYNEGLAQRRAQSVVDYLISQGIDKERMVAKGYGEAEPKTLDSAAYSKLSPARQKMFAKGDVMKCDWITKFEKTDSAKFDAAHQINRRTEFKVLRTDYVPKAEGEAKSEGAAGE